MGKGKISQVVTKQGVVLSDWEMNYYSDMNVQGINSQDYIQMMFCLNEGVSWNIANDRQGVHISKGESLGWICWLSYPYLNLVKP